MTCPQPGSSADGSATVWQQRRSLVVWTVAATGLMSVFMGFVIVGWPGHPDTCVGAVPDSCYCEAFDRDAVATVAGGVRQPANTWFNLYALGTSLWVALTIRQDRRIRPARNLVTSTSLVSDLYVLLVLFLGLGSMWFHASLKRWGGDVDGLSMYMFVAYLICYTMHRMWRSEPLFWLAYVAIVASAVAIHTQWRWHGTPPILVSTMVFCYLLAEGVNCARQRAFMLGRRRSITLWLAAAASITIGTVVWYLSRTGGVLCNPSTVWQPHALVWHTLAGASAVLLHRYWREENVTLPPQVGASRT